MNGLFTFPNPVNEKAARVVAAGVLVLAAVTLAAAILALLLAEHGAAEVLLAGMILAAALEAGLAICLGCHVFALLMRVGIIPDAVCADCADIWSR